MEPAPTQALPSAPSQPPLTRSNPRTRLATIAAAVSIAFCVPLLCHCLGFVGISNDDAARSLIAWDFSRAPHLDPTRSSWLPVPTYILGSTLALTRDLATTPRVLSLLCAIGAFVATVRSARSLGASSGWALWAGAVPMLFAWSFYPSWAPATAETYAACFVCWAYALLPGDEVTPSRGRMLAAGLLLSLACGSRYEAWLVSLGFVAAVAWRYRGCPSRVLTFCTAASLGPVAWLVLNAHRAGDPIEFIHRVTTFHAAEHAVPRSAGSYPFAIASEMGVLVALAVAAALVGRRARESVLAWAGSFALAAGLVGLDLRGGGATHHPDRALGLLPWLLSPTVAVHLARVRWAPIRYALAALVSTQLAFTLRNVPRDLDPATIAVGRAVRRMSPPRYFLESGRLDFLWLEYASSIPERASPDRAYGAPAPPPPNEPALASGLPLAVVHRETTVAAFEAAGWRTVGGEGGWRILAPPR